MAASRRAPSSRHRERDRLPARPARRPDHPPAPPEATRATTRVGWHTETVYAVTDLGVGDIRADQLTAIIQDHWSIENKLHWIRDVTFAEDHSQIRTGNGPAVMASLRNLAISRHRLAGSTNITAACRHTSRHPIRATDLLI